MARRGGWTNLSVNQRKRYERNGISRADYEGGISLQKARGQEIERTRAKENIEAGLPAPSTIRMWRARALRNKVTRTDWDNALETTGLENFDELKDVVRAKEKAHKLWQSQGAPSSKIRKAMRTQGTYGYTEYDTPDDWGDSWGYYH
jgi:hypothetical protein